jgi:hypothetical protein
MAYIDGWIPKVLANGKTVWTPVDQPKQKAQPQQQIDIDQITAEQIRKRAAQLEQERRDNEQRLQNTSRVNHAEQTPQSPEEIEAAEAKRKADCEYREERKRQLFH